MDVMGSPRAALKMKTRDAVNKIKCGSPKFQEILRQVNYCDTIYLE